MTVDLKEWQEMQQRAVQARKPDARNLRLMVQAEVAAEDLMADQHWRLYQSYLQHAVDVLTDAVEEYKRSLVDPSTVNQEFISTIKSMATQAQAKIEALEWAIKLPRDIVQNGENAKDLYAGEEDGDGKAN